MAMHVVERVGIRDAFSLSRKTWMWHILAGDMKHTVFSEGPQPLATSMSRLQFWTVQVMNHDWPLHKRFYNKYRYINFLHCCGVLCIFVGGGWLTGQELWVRGCFFQCPEDCHQEEGARAKSHGSVIIWSSLSKDSEHCEQQLRCIKRSKI